MKFTEIVSQLEGIPFISPHFARVLYNFILEEKPLQCLELGFAHGASSCYIAAALDELGTGHLTCVDLLSSKQRKPSIEDLLSQTNLESYVTVLREKHSYNWFLKKVIQEQSTCAACEPIYDFCFIDGSKNWAVDGFAFFLVDKLLRKGGWILFDDYSWSYADRQRSATDGIVHREMSQDQLVQPNVGLIFTYLVMQHPDYSEFKIQDGRFAWARKVRSCSKVVSLDTSVTFRFTVVALLRKLKKGFV